MLKIAITGGIGSGKSTACREFAKLDVPVYYSDIRAKILWDTDSSLRQRLESTYGDGFYPDGYLDRSRLAELIFSDTKAMARVNSWIQPAVRQDFEQWCSSHDFHYVIHEAAIIFEAKMENLFDKVILVTAPEILRIERVYHRDNLAISAVRARIASQWPDERKIPRADFIILNGEKNDLKPQVLDIHEQLMNL